jgi:hypothetical protein
MNNKEEFSALMLYQTENYLWDCGSYLAKRYHENYEIKLFLADGKYFEVYQIKAGESIIKIMEIGLEEVINLYGPGVNDKEKQVKSL